MATPVHITDGKGKGRDAVVTSTGQLAVGPLAYNTAKFVELAEDDVGYNFFQPKAGKRFVLDGMIVFADKQVGTTTNAVVVIYEAEGGDGTATGTTVLQFELGQNNSINLSGLNILTAEAAFINAKTSDDDVHMTLLGYYIDT